MSANISDEKEQEKREILQPLSYFSKEQTGVIENLLVLCLPYDNIVQAFLDRYPDVLEDCELSDDLTESEREKVTDSEIEAAVRDVILSRVKERNYNKRRGSYAEIVRKKKEIAAILGDIPVMDPFHRIKEMEIMRQGGSLTFDQRLKLFAAAIREYHILMPRDHRASSTTFSMLPDLIPTQTASETDNDASETPQKDPFGGAMMQNAHTRQETSEDS